MQINSINYKKKIIKKFNICEVTVINQLKNSNFNNYEELYFEFKKRLFVAKKLAEFLIDKDIHFVKSFFYGNRTSKICKSQSSADKLILFRSNL